jgi:cytochrome c peroxidase
MDVTHFMTFTVVKQEIKKRSSRSYPMISKKIITYMVFLTTVVTFGFPTMTESVHKLTLHEQFGKSIFFDKNLSVNRNQSCATCHDPAAGWTGPDSEINAHGAVYNGSIKIRFGDRKPPTAAYAAVSPIFHFNKREGLFIGGNFWDGRATGEKLGNAAADQAQGPFLNPVEQALPDAACVVHRVCNANYSHSLESINPGECEIAWPQDVDVNRECDKGNTIMLSHDQQTRVDQAFNAIALAFDYYLKGMAELTKEEKKGLDLFNGEGKCAECHISDGVKPLFTDFTYDNLGVPVNPENPVYEGNPSYIDKGLGGFLEKPENPKEWQKLAQENMGKQKVPTLRNVDKREAEDFVKSYMHNGYFKTLKGVVNFYNTRDVKPACSGLYIESHAHAEGCWPKAEVKDNVNKDELGNLGLTDKEEEAIVAFMKTLSDGFITEKKK